MLVQWPTLIFLSHQIKANYKFRKSFPKIESLDVNYKELSQIFLRLLHPAEVLHFFSHLSCVCATPHGNDDFDTQEVGMQPDKLIVQCLQLAYCVFQREGATTGIIYLPEEQILFLKLTMV